MTITKSPITDAVELEPVLLRLELSVAVMERFAPDNRTASDIRDLVGAYRTAERIQAEQAETIRELVHVVDHWPVNATGIINDARALLLRLSNKADHGLGERTVTLPPLTEDQRAYIKKAVAKPIVDLTHVVGGPRAQGTERIPNETGWLIEQWSSRTGHLGAKWWSLRPGDSEPGWVSDSTKALRFAREIDAQEYINEIGWTEAKPTEHQWIATPAERGLEKTDG